MHAFLIALTTVAIAEIGDRTQLLALLLSARFRRPLPILAGVLCSTVVCNGIAAFLGLRLGAWLTPRLLDALVGASMLLMGVWTLRPDRPAKERSPQRASAFVATFIAFTLAETGDKTQIATMALAAAWSSLWYVLAGSTLGMFVANAPAVLLGHAFAQRLPLRAINVVASLLFMGIGGYFIWRALHVH